MVTASTNRNATGQERRPADDGVAWPVRIWLFVIAALVFAIIIVGGATRLTDSGLSITEWAPVLGAIPPLSEQDWQAALEKYRRIPEYQVINRGMSLEEFKFIYWWEWGHRLLGRFIGIAFLVPLVWFWIRGYLAPDLKPKLVALFILGGLQGALGWYMVMSGLVGRVDVSQYRLAAHLGLAVLIFSWTFWIAMSRTVPGGARARPRAAWLIVALLYIQIVLGAFVAGLDAGQGYNTWPLMDGKIVPDGLLAASPWYLNLFENALTVQFDHRVGAYVIVAAALFHTVALFRADSAAKDSALILLLAIVGQAALGVWTLLARVRVDLGLLHQGGAIAVLAIALWHVKRSARAEGRPPL